MKSKVAKLFFTLIALGSLSFAALECSQIGQTFEEKSLYSYMYKTGDSNPTSEGALAHIKDSKSYGYVVAARVGVSSAVFGLLLGVFITSGRQRRNAA